MSNLQNCPYCNSRNCFLPIVDDDVIKIPSPAPGALTMCMGCHKLSILDSELNNVKIELDNLSKKEQQSIRYVHKWFTV